MRTLKLTDSGDIDLTGNTLNVLEGTDELDQYIRTLLNIRKGEWFLDTDLGLSHENLFSKNPDLEFVRLDIIEVLGQEPRITEIVELDISFNNQTRNATIEFTVRTVNGDIVNGEVVV